MAETLLWMAIVAGSGDDFDGGRYSVDPSKHAILRNLGWEEFNARRIVNLGDQIFLHRDRGDGVRILKGSDRTFASSEVKDLYMSFISGTSHIPADCNDDRHGSNIDLGFERAANIFYLAEKTFTVVDTDEELVTLSFVECGGMYENLISIFKNDQQRPGWYDVIKSKAFAKNRLYAVATEDEWDGVVELKNIVPGTSETFVAEVLGILQLE